MLLDEIKALSNINDNSNDERIETLIELYKGVADEYCNNVFVEPYPFGVKKFIADSISYGKNTGLSSRTMGTVSYSFVSDLPNSVYKPLRPLKKLSWRGKYDNYNL